MLPLPRNADCNREMWTTRPKCRMRRRGGKLLTLFGHSGDIYAVAYSPDGNYIVPDSSWENIAKVWDATMGAEVLSLNGHSEPITAVVYSPDGNHIVTGSDDGTIKVCLVDIDQLLELAEQRIQRQVHEFTPEERQRFGLD